MIVPLIADTKILAERIAEAKARRKKADRDQLIHQLAREQSAYNSWAAGAGRQHPGRFAGLIGVNPVLFGEDWTRREIEARLAEGAVGIKILPMYIGVYPERSEDGSPMGGGESARVLPVLTLATAHIPPEALSKIGVSENYTDIHHPSRFEDVVRSYPRIKLVLAHLGLGAEQDTIRLAGKYANVFTDTSLRLHEVGQPGGWSLKETCGDLPANWDRPRTLRHQLSVRRPGRVYRRHGGDSANRS